MLKSKRGYIGPGIIVDVAYSGHYLVKIETEPKPSVIVVRFQDLRKSSSNTVVQKKKK